jgi:hypothetical protein
MSSSSSEGPAGLETEARAYPQSAIILAAAEVILLEQRLTPEWFGDWQVHQIDQRTSVMVGCRTARSGRD